MVRARDLVRFDYSLDYANAPSVTGSINNTLNQNFIPEFPFPEPATWSHVFLLSCYGILRRRGTGAPPADPGRTLMTAPLVDESDR